jgi:hypothetical protein
MEHIALRGLLGRIAVRTPPQSIVWTPHNFGLDEPQGPLGKQTLGAHKTALCTLETAVLPRCSLEHRLAAETVRGNRWGGRQGHSELFNDAVSTAQLIYVGLSDSPFDLPKLVCFKSCSINYSVYLGGEFGAHIWFAETWVL